MANKDLLYSTGNSTQYSVLTCMGKYLKRGGVCMYVCVCVCVCMIHFAVQQKLTQHCKSIVLQEKNFLKKKEKDKNPEDNM